MSRPIRHEEGTWPRVYSAHCALPAARQNLNAALGMDGHRSGYRAPDPSALKGGGCPLTELLRGLERTLSSASKVSNLASLQPHTLKGLLLARDSWLAAQDDEIEKQHSQPGAAPRIGFAQQ